jgi:hypothetical protein
MISDTPCDHEKARAILAHIGRLDDFDPYQDYWIEETEDGQEHLVDCDGHVYATNRATPSWLSPGFPPGPTRTKMSAAKKGRTSPFKGKPLSPEHRANISAALKGKTLSAETRAKMSAARKGRPLTAEHRAKLSAARKGKTLSAETRAKMSAALKGRTPPADSA